MSNKQTAEIISSQVICKQPGRYIGWPTIGKAPNGEILVVFSGDRDAHVDPFGKTFLMRSRDNGQSWDEPELIHDTPLDDRDAGICVCSDGTVLVSWFTSHYEDQIYMGWAPADEKDRWRDKIGTVSTADIQQWAGRTVMNGRYAIGHWTRRSTDNGRTWEDPVRVPPSTPHGPITLSDGRLIYVGIEGNQGRPESRGDVLAAESRDQGRTWSVIGRANMYPEYVGDAPGGCSYLTEPHVVEVSPGKLLAMARYEEIPREKEKTRSVLWQFTSDDGGHTWTEPRPTEIKGTPRKSWDYDNEIVLCDDAPSGDLGYPASVELDDGTILTVYYQQERAGEKTCLMTTLWRSGK